MIGQCGKIVKAKLARQAVLQGCPEVLDKLRIGLRTRGEAGAQRVENAFPGAGALDRARS
jgi:hypothetical protein